jgi:hypothetical protein
MRRRHKIRKERLLRKYNMEKDENLDQVTEELQKKCISKDATIFRCRKIQNQYYQNKMCRTHCKKFLRQKNTNVKNEPTKE